MGLPLPNFFKILNSVYSHLEKQNIEYQLNLRTKTVESTDDALS